MIVQEKNCLSIEELLISEYEWDSAVIRRISFCLNIRTLTLVGHRHDPFANNEDFPPVHLPNLRRLELLGYIPITVLTSIIPNANMVVKMKEIKVVERYLDSYLDSVTTLKGTPLAAEMRCLSLGWSDRAVDHIGIEGFQALLHTARSLREIQWSQYANSRLLAVVEASSVSRRADFSITVSS